MLHWGGGLGRQLDRSRGPPGAPRQAQSPTSCRSTQTTGSSPSTHCTASYPSTYLNNSEEHQLLFLICPVRLITDMLGSLVRSGLSLFFRITLTAISGELYRQRRGRFYRICYRISPFIQTRVTWLVSASSWEIWLTSRRSLL